MKYEETLYPTDLLRMKYVTVMEAADKCNTTVAKIVDMIEKKTIPYALFSAEGKRSKIVHVNYEDVQRVLDEERNAS